MRKITLLAAAAMTCIFLAAQDAPAPKPAVIESEAAIPLTLVNEANAAVKRGSEYLLKGQKEDGSWLNSPAITGLVAMSLVRSNLAGAETCKSALEKGRQYILKNAQPDGSIQFNKEYINYSTAICLSALAVIGNPADEPVMRKARRFLIGSQLDEDNKDNPTKPDNAFYGGIGYGSGGPEKPDLSNTQLALEALYLTEYLDKEPKLEKKEDAEKSELAWKNAVQFLNRVQHMPESNDQQWVVKDPKDPNYGGFIYKPDESKASGKFKDAESLRSYGSMTYAGLKSMIYAKVKKDDPRVKAAIEWASKNYTLDENPGMGPEGLYYYIHTFTKAHSVLGDDFIVTPDGKKHPWRTELIRKLLQVQRGNGEWFNENGRWNESVPEIVTAYALLSLEAALGPELKK